jgi:hypothetical protein
MTKAAKMHLLDATYPPSDPHTVCAMRLVETTDEDRWGHVEGNNIVGMVYVTTMPRDVTCARCARGVNR